MKKAFGIVFLALMVFACTYENEEELYNTNTNTEKKIDFNTEIQPILDTYCASCHNNANNPNNGFGNRFGEAVTLEGEENVKTIVGFNNQFGYLIGNIRHDDGFMAMPFSGKVSDAEIALIEQWIAQEFPETGDSTTTLYDTTFVTIYDTVTVIDTVDVVDTTTQVVEAVSYADDIVPILQSNCYNCHNEGTSPRLTRFGTDLNMANYEDVKTSIEYNDQEGYLIGNVKKADGFKGMGNLSDSDIKLIEDWISEGIQNN